jgi:hypothetical protein
MNLLNLLIFKGLKNMGKLVLKKKTKPLGGSLYIVSVVESIHKGKSVLVYADSFEIDDQGLLCFKVLDEIVYVLRSGDWKSIQLYEDEEDFLKCVRFMTIEQRLEEIKVIRELEEEAARKAAEEAEKRRLELERVKKELEEVEAQED